MHHDTEHAAASTAARRSGVLGTVEMSNREIIKIVAAVIIIGGAALIGYLHMATNLQVCRMVIDPINRWVSEVVKIWDPLPLFDLVEMCNKL